MWFYCCTCFGQSCFATQLEAVLVVSHEIHHGTTQSQLGRSADHPQCHHPLPKQFGCDETAELQTASDWSFGFLSNELDVFLALRCLKQAKKASSDTVDWYNNIYIYNILFSCHILSLICAKNDGWIASYWFNWWKIAFARRSTDWFQGPNSFLDTFKVMRRHMSLAIGHRWPNSIINFESLSKWWSTVVHSVSTWLPLISKNEMLVVFARITCITGEFISELRNTHAEVNAGFLFDFKDKDGVEITSARQAMRRVWVDSDTWRPLEVLWSAATVGHQKHIKTYQLTYNPMHTMTMRSTNSNEHSGKSLCSTWRVNLSCFDMFCAQVGGWEYRTQAIRGCWYMQGLG